MGRLELCQMAAKLGATRVRKQVRTFGGKLEPSYFLGGACSTQLRAYLGGRAALGEAYLFCDKMGTSPEAALLCGVGHRD